MMKVWLFRLASVVVPLVPRRVGCSIAGLIGSLAYYLAPSARRTVESNMRVVLGRGAAPAKLSWAARGVFRNAAKNYFDLFWLPRLDMVEYRKMVSTAGFEYLDEALEAGKGAIVITAHLGNFEICGQEIAARSLDATVLVEPLKPPEIHGLITRLREGKGVKWIPVGPAVLKEAVRVLRRGAVLGIACDRDIQKAGLSIPFFGVPASLPQGAAHLALRTGARIVPAFSERLPDERFVIYVEPPLEIVKSGDFEADVQKAMAAIVGALERHIGARPDQWVVFESIWSHPVGSRAD